MLTKNGRDPGVIQRLEYVIDFFGDIPITGVDTPALERLVRDLERRPGLYTRSGHKLSKATINRYLDAASAVLTYAHQRTPRYIRGQASYTQAARARRPSGDHL
jgi:hypothetical protein